jgi:tetratricopeptide (TPR) repeat protein
MKILKYIFIIIFFCPFIIFSQAGDIRLAIMPFENVSSKKQYDWIGMGIAESLSNSLAYIPAIQLIDRMHLEQIISEQGLSLTGLVDEKYAPKIGNMVSANQMLSGTFQIHNNEILINSRIILVETAEIEKGKSASVKGNIDDIFNLYEELAFLVLRNFNIVANDNEKQIIETIAKSTVSTDAYRLYLEGKQKLYSFTLNGYKDAIEFFTNATVEDPTFALAYAGLAEAQASSAYEKSVMAEQINIYQEKEEDIKRRQEEYKRLFIEAQGNARTALSLASNLPDAHRAIALIYYYMGDYEQAKINALTLLKLNKNEAFSHYIIGSVDDDLEKGLKYIRKALELNPGLGIAYRDIGYYYESKKDYPKAYKAYSEGVKILPLNPDLRKDLTNVLFRLSRFDEAEIHIDKALQYRENDAYILLLAAIIYFKNGKDELAFSYFDKAFSLNWHFYSFPSIFKEKYLWDSNMLSAWHELKLAYEEKR